MRQLLRAVQQPSVARQSNDSEKCHFSGFPKINYSGNRFCWRIPGPGDFFTLCKNLILLFILSTLLSACGFSGSTIPADHFYRLPAPVPSTVATVVEIKAVQADGVYHERALLFVDNTRPLELQRYSYHFWALTPAKMLQNYLQTCLVRPDTVQVSDNKQPPIQLSPVIESFERVLANDQAQAVIKLRINQRRYEATVVAESMDMHATVAAYGQAMQKICTAVANDL